MSLDVPLIVTSFLDFELEERAVRLLSGMGFRIADRRILSKLSLEGDEILVMDQANEPKMMINSRPSIVVPQEASHWSDARLFSFFQRHFIIEIDDVPASDLLVCAGDSVAHLRSDLISYLSSSSLAVMQARFEERDIQLALIPTRRSEEISRLSRFARARIALYLLAADLDEVQRAKRFMEYRERIHRHLQLGFVVFGGRRTIRTQVTAALEPFPVFHISGRDDDLLRLSFASSHGQKMQRFQQIMEWIGSCHGIARESDDQLSAPRRRRDRAPFGIGSAVAASR